VIAAIFYLAGAMALGSAIAVVLQRNPFLAALGLIFHFASLAVLYLVLRADFVAAAQVLVYAGAVMIMFLFVIAYLGDKADIPMRGTGIGNWVAGTAGVLIFVETVVAVTRSDKLFEDAANPGPSFGSPAAVGEAFMTDYLLAFELVSLLLLVGAIAGVVLGAAHLGGAAPPKEADALAVEKSAPAAPAPAEPSERIGAGR
jgi:NADH:ubiquinone oxidoreductase subunit 6 (subunit J)